MALNAALRKKVLGPPTKYKTWFNMLQQKAKTPDDALSVSGLATVCDYYGIGMTADEIKAKNNFEVKWDNWKHLATPGLVDKLKAKVDAMNAEQYETEALAAEAMEESEGLKQWGHLVTWNAVLHLTYIAEQDTLLENLYHARPMGSLDRWELESMWKYEDVASRWDQELGWYMPNNDQISEDTVTTNYFQFQKDFGKIGLTRYYYDWMGRHQVLSTVGKLSQTEREE